MWPFRPATVSSSPRRIEGGEEFNGIIEPFARLVAFALKCDTGRRQYCRKRTYGMAVIGKYVDAGMRNNMVGDLPRSFKKNRAYGLALVFAQIIV
ncbi:hypothetical protein D3C71_1823200 [compost metagenome]